jgi:hypothetical protein
MDASRFGSVTALLGGLAWVVSAALGWGSEPNDYFYLAGAGLMLLALGAFGYALVATAPLWLRVVVTVATAALGYMVWLAVLDLFGTEHLALLFGGLVLLLGAGLTLSRLGDGEVQPQGRGSHAAR